MLEQSGKGPRPQPPRGSFVTKETGRTRDDKLHQGTGSAAIEDSERREADDFTSDVLENLRNLQADLVTINKGYHRRLYQILAGAYEDAETLDRDESAWDRFCQEPFWKKCKNKPEESDDHDAVILWVLRFIFQAASTKGTQYNRAYKHARTLQGYAREGVPIEEVAEKLAKEGADYAFRRETKENPRQTKGQGGSQKGQSRRSASGSGQSGGEHTPQRGKGHGEERPVPKRGGKGPPAAPKQASASSTISADTKTAISSIIPLGTTPKRENDVLQAIRQGRRVEVIFEGVSGTLAGKPGDVRVRPCEVRCL